MIPLHEFEKEMPKNKKYWLADFIFGLVIGLIGAVFGFMAALGQMSDDCTDSGKADRGKTRQYVQHYVVGQKVN